ncbi:MAG: glycosyl hydrolase [Phycisphaerae bacterium]|nr:glycosyl hydrolase [Phycisphaerae bacterium]
MSSDGSFNGHPRLLYGCNFIPAKWNRYDAARDEYSFEKIREMGGTHTWVELGWESIENQPGQWSFKDPDRYVELMRKRQLEPIGYMGRTPEWALPESAKNNPQAYYRVPADEKYEREFIRYCKQVATRYRGKIKYYQFWNEPNGCGWVQDNCRNMDQYALYTRWMIVWYKAMKEADPDCVLGGGVIDYPVGLPDGYKYLEGMYQSGAKDHMDAVSIHPYDKRGGTLHWQAILDTRRVMVEHGDGDKPIWITEYGWQTVDEANKVRRLTEVLTALNNPEYAYVTIATYLSLNDPPNERDFGLCHDDLSPRQSYDAFKAFTSKNRSDKNLALTQPASTQPYRSP